MNRNIRLAKSGSSWTVEDLRAYRVNVVDTDAAAFFGTKQLPHPSVSPELLTISDFVANKEFLTKSDQLFFAYMYAAMQSSPDADRAMSNFTIHLLHLLGFGQMPNRLIRRNVDLPLYTCGRSLHVTADVCLWDPIKQTPLMIIKEDRRVCEPRSGHPEPQLFAQAIAAFQSYNRALRAARLPPVETKVIPAIVMMGATPVLYKFEITAGLVESVQSGQRPTKVTTVQRLVPPVNRHLLLREEGMVPVDNRGVMLSCLEGLKAFV